MSRLFVLIAIAAMVGVPVSTASAEDRPDASDQGAKKVVAVATVNIRNLELKGNENGLITAAFDISNREGVQPKVIYAVSLVEKRETGVPFVADRKVYDEDVLTLGAGESIHREITYSVSAYLKGTYTLRVEARNPEGLLFGMMPATGEIVLSGIGESVAIDPATCFLSVAGEAGDKRYTLSQGVDVSSGEALSAHCTLKSAFASDKAVVPIMEVRHRSVFGKIIHTEKLAPIMIAAGQTLDFSAEIVKPEDPQAYEATLVFSDEQGKRLSAPVDFHFVLRGGSATIQNITLDKSSYQKGETAQALFFWSAAADGFLGARTEKPSGSRLSMDISLTDGNRNICAETLHGDFDATRHGGAEHLSLPVTRDCQDAVVTARISDENGKVLAESTDVFALDKARQTSSDEATGARMDSRYIVGAYAVIILLVISLLGYLIKRHRRTGMAAFFGLVMFSSILLGSERVSADTYYAHDGIIFSYGLDKDTYLAGEPIKASGDIYFGLCSNSHPELSLKTTINGVTKDLTASGMESFAAPLVSGTHLAMFDMSYFLWWYDTEEEKLDNWIETAAYAASIPYTVTAPVYACTGDVPAHASMYASDNIGLLADTARAYAAADTAAKCEFSCDSGYVWDGSVCAAPTDPTLSFTIDPSAIAYGGTATLSWTTTGATSCFAWGGGIDGWKSLNGSQEVLPVSTTTYSMECWNAIGVSSGQKDAVVSVNPPAAPIVDLKVNGLPGSANIASGDTKDLSWTVVNATSCIASGDDGFANSKATTIGAESLVVHRSSIDTLTCSGPGGTNSDSVQITATCPTPSVARNDGSCVCDTEKKDHYEWSPVLCDWVVSSRIDCAAEEKNSCRDFNWKEVTP